MMQTTDARFEHNKTQPLVVRDTNRFPRTSEKCRECCPIRYRIIHVTEKAAIFMIVLNMFFLMATLSCYEYTKSGITPGSHNSPWLSIPVALVLVSCPVLGLISDCCSGRYNVLRASIFLLLLSIVLKALDIVFIAVDKILIGEVFQYIMLATVTLSLTLYVSCVIPFTMDQLVGASGEEFSFTIYWILWPVVVIEMLKLVTRPMLPRDYALFNAILFGISSLSFAVMYCMILCCNHVLMTKPQTFNTLKLISQVLNYARKHKFPERRSAFTYWEEDYPSRLDLGKDKYGGPFTFEEVENVKTVLGLFPLIICISPALAFYGKVTYDTSSILKEDNDLRLWITIVWCLLAASYLPVHQFVIYPIFYSYIPSMLRRIGGGMFLVVFAHALTLMVEIFVVEQNNTNHTKLVITKAEGESTPIPISSWLILAANLTRHVGLCLTFFTTVEFTTAQSPCQVRGFGSFLLLEMYAIFTCLQGLFFILDHLIAHAVIFTIISSFFILFVFLSKRYKLRQRDDAIPYHVFAENEFESNYKQEREYLKEHGWLSS